METLMDKILVIQTAFIGDAILTLPMLQELKRLNTESTLDVIAIPSTASIFHSSNAVDDVILLDKRGKHKSIFKLLNFCREIKKKNYSRIYSPHRSFRSSFIVLQSGVRETYGFINSSFSYVYRNPVLYAAEDHEVKRNLSLAGVDVSGDNWKIPPLINVTVDEKLKIKAFIDHAGFKSFISIAPGSIWATKIYPVEYFKAVIEYLTLQGENVILLGGPKDKELCDSFTATPNVISAAGEFSITESVELLRYSKLLICNDSAPTHMGQAAEIPVLTLYCSTIPEIGFYPYNKFSSYLSYEDLSCKPCGIHGRTSCPLNHFKCGYNLEPASVIFKIKEILDDKTE